MTATMWIILDTVLRSIMLMSFCMVIYVAVKDIKNGVFKELWNGTCAFDDDEYERN